MMVRPFEIAPRVAEMLGVTEVFCDIATVQLRSETVRVLLAREIDGRYELVGNVWMPRQGFENFHAWASRALGSPPHMLE